MGDEKGTVTSGNLCVISLRVCRFLKGEHIWIWQGKIAMLIKSVPKYVF